MTDAVFKVRVSVEPEGAATAEWDGEGLAGIVVKASPESRYTLTVAYPANKPDVGVARDGFRDFAAERDVEDCAWNYMLKSRNVGLWHEDGTDGAGHVVESYIYRGPDWTVNAANGSQQVIKGGDWLLGIQWSEDTWPLVKEGRIGGVSMQGKASRSEPDLQTLSGLRI